jgi:flagellar biosynthesis protein FlhF
MKAEKFVARDTKKALEKVKAKLGANALIVSTERSDLGIEISALCGENYTSGKANTAGSTEGRYSDEITLGYLDRELKALRGALYNALGERTWREVAQKAPTQSALEQRFHTLGLGKWAVDVATSNVDLSEGLNNAWFAALSNLMSEIPTHNDFHRKVDTRPTALVGGTASCRSLICRQLITQFLQASKPSNIVLISVTPDPSGALQDFCKSKKVKRIHVATISEAKLHLKRLKSRNKIVIETGDLMPTLGAKDPMLELFVDHELSLEILSVLPAVHQSEVLRSSARHIEHLPITGVIISRISEAVSLGAVLDSLVAGKAPLIGISRDFDSVVHPISPHSLIGVAKKLTRGQIAAGGSNSVSHGYSRTA